MLSITSCNSDNNIVNQKIIYSSNETGLGSIDILFNVGLDSTIRFTKLLYTTTRGNRLMVYSMSDTPVYLLDWTSPYGIRTYSTSNITGNIEITFITGGTVDLQYTNLNLSDRGVFSFVNGQYETAYGFDTVKSFYTY